MNHKGTVTIETQRLILRRFTESDIPLAFANWMSDEKVTTFLCWPTHQSISDTETIVHAWMNDYQRSDFYLWVIELKEIHQPIGTISVVGMDEQLSLVHIGYCIGSRWWHQGITSEALTAIIPFFFEEVGVNRIESQHDPNNPHSGAVMRKCGLVYEGTLRQADHSNRGIVDACMYALLAQDYFAVKRI